MAEHVSGKRKRERKREREIPFHTEDDIFNRLNGPFWERRLKDVHIDRGRESNRI